MLVTLTFREHAVTVRVTAYFHSSCCILHMKCEDCEKLKSVLEVVKGAISKYTMQLGKVQAEDRLYEANNAAAKILEWKGHIL